MGASQSTSNQSINTPANVPAIQQVPENTKSSSKETPQHDFSVSPPPITAAKPEVDTLGGPGEFEEIGKRVKGIV